MYDVCAENSPVAAMISKEGIDKEGESTCSLSPRPSKVEKPSCSKEVRNKGTKECCVAAVSPDLWGEAKGKRRKSIEDRKREDPELKLIIDYQKEGVLPCVDKKARELLLSRAQYHMEGGVLYYVEADKLLCLIPPTGYRKHLFEEAHCGKFGTDLGGAKVHGQLSKHYWWPRMRADISGWYQDCLVCATHQPDKAIRPPLMLILVEGPFHRVGVDVIQFVKSHSGNQYAIVFTNNLTKWPEVFAAKDQTAFTIAELFVEEIVCCHGVPPQLLSDRGAVFLSYLITEICKLLGTDKLNTMAHHPQTNGLTNDSIEL